MSRPCTPYELELISTINDLKDANKEMASTLISIKDILNKLGDPNPMEQDILNIINECLTKHGVRNE